MGPESAAAWRDLFVGMVAAGASLAGLTFVAIALDPRQIERTALLRLRAASALGCFVTVLFIGIAVLTPRPFVEASALITGLGALLGAVLLLVAQIRQRTFSGPHPGATPWRAAANLLGFVLAGAGSLALIVVEAGWVLYMLSLACMIMLASGIFANWLLVLQVGVPTAEKPAPPG